MFCIVLLLDMFRWIINYYNYFVLGAPSNFCQGKSNGLFGNPDNRQQFFQCSDGRSSLCQTCPSTLVFSDSCRMCIYPTSSTLLFFNLLILLLGCYYLKFCYLNLSVLLHIYIELLLSITANCDTKPPASDTTTQVPDTTQAKPSMCKYYCQREKLINWKFHKTNTIGNKRIYMFILSIKLVFLFFLFIRWV